MHMGMCGYGLVYGLWIHDLNGWFFLVCVHNANSLSLAADGLLGLG